MADYEQGDVPEYWLIDPLEEKVLFYQQDDTWQYAQADLISGDIYHSQVIAGFWLKVSWLWQKPLPSPLRILAKITGVPASVTEAFEQAIVGETLIFQLRQPRFERKMIFCNLEIGFFIYGEEFGAKIGRLI